MRKLFKYFILVLIVVISVTTLISIRDNATFISYSNNETGHTGQIKIYDTYNPEVKNSLTIFIAPAGGAGFS